MSSAATIGQALEMLRAKFPAEHPEINAQTVSVWLGALHRYPDTTVIQAAMDWMAFHFPDLNQFADHTRTVARSMLEREQEARRAEGAVTVACPECGDGAGMVEDQGRQMVGYDVPVRPCATCSFKAFWLWRHGHYGPDHTCQMCRDRRKNPKALDDAIAADGGQPRQGRAGVLVDAEF